MSVDWKARREAVAQADGEEWDALHEAFEEDWIAAYRRAFITCAVARPGWTESVAKEWLDAGDLPREALLNYGFQDKSLEEIALADVMECENQAYHAQ